MTFFITKHKNNGYILIDAIIAIAVLGVIVAIVFPLLSAIYDRTTLSRAEMQSTYVMQNTIEASYAALVSLRNWESIGYNNPYHPVENFDEKKWELKNGVQNNYESLFKRRVEFHKVCRDPEREGIEVSCDAGETDLNTRRMVVELRWIDSSEIEQSRTVEVLVSKYIQ